MSYTCLIAIRNSVEEKSSLGRQLALCDDHERALTLRPQRDCMMETVRRQGCARTRHIMVLGLTEVISK